MSEETTTIVRDDRDSAPGLPAYAPPSDGIDSPPIELTAQQQEAIKMIMLGASTGKIAKALHIDRGTLYRWRNRNAHFMAAVNRWRSEVQTEIRTRVLRITKKAAKSLENAIDDARLSLRVLEKTGSMDLGPIGPVDPYAVFGAGLADEAVRGPVGDGFQRLSSLVSNDQRKRAAELLALGIAIDDRRSGRQTSKEILDMAGPLPEPPMLPDSLDVTTTATLDPSSGESVSGQKSFSIKTHVVCYSEKRHVQYRCGDASSGPVSPVRRREG